MEGYGVVSMDIDVIIVGGGASGLFAAVLCARYGAKVVVLEQKDRIGKKLLATGNGKCNYTNFHIANNCYRGDNRDFTEIGLGTFGPEQAVACWEELGIYPKNKNGYIYPYSEQASAVLDVLRMELDIQNVSVYCQEKVLDIAKNKGVFRLKTEKGHYTAKKVILATGGKSSPKLGSDGSGYTLAKKMGHSIVEPVPALIGLQCKEDYYKSISGVRTEAELSVYIDDNKKSRIREKGELQLTAYGISGIPVFQISRYAARAKAEGKKVQVQIDYLPGVKKAVLDEMLKKRFRTKSKTAEEACIGLLHKKLASLFLRLSGIKTNMPAKAVSDEQRKKLVENIKALRTEVMDTNGFEQAQVTAGGVSTWEIAPDTMESILVPGLYFTGEVMDVDGICGGYNLQWCWSSAYLAADHIRKHIAPKNR